MSSPQLRQIQRLSVLSCKCVMGKIKELHWLCFVQFLCLFVTGDNRWLTIFFPAAGNYSGTTLNNHGENGNYWSSSVIDATNARNLNFNASGVNPQNSNNRYYGRSLRPVQHLS